VWVRESPSIFAYTTILSLHAIGLAIIGIRTLIALRLLGFVGDRPDEGLLVDRTLVMGSCFLLRL